ncbi:MAG: hypothetical protein E5Y58_24825 [Mesorhizobium sp.]|nr:MAG: hypothetical protein E5Y58_24825 [Mesorhizobium sp.]
MPPIVPRIFAVTLFCLSVAAGSASATGGKRVALVIGNSSYLSVTPLSNAANDAREFAKFLAENGFEVDNLVNVGRAEFAKGLSNFSKKLSPEDTALFYFAGHGMQLKGENFLLGLDAELQSEFDVDAETVSLNSIIETMERKASLSLIFIDACRNNPIADRLNIAVEGATRGGTVKGLAPVSSTGSGTMIAFAASPGQVAYDGGGSNSPFTMALIEHLASPSLEVGTAFKRVIRDVRVKTGNDQSPQIVSNLAAEFYFNESAPSDEAASLMLAQIDFEKAERISTARGWQLYLAKYQSGAFADSARDALRLLQGGSEELVSPKEAEAKLKLTQAQRKEIQLALADLGYDIGSADGTIGLKTRREIARYQKAMGLSETGYINRVMANRLELVGISSSDSVISADEARTFDPNDLKGLETDERVIRAARCLAGKEIIYGEFEGHLYVAAYTRSIRIDAAKQLAKGCEAYLVAIGSKAENDFVYDLFAADDRMFISGFDTRSGYSWKIGPWIGLEQAEGAREPRGGWGWQNGEKLKFTNWGEGQPGEYTPHRQWGTYLGDKLGRVDMSKVDAREWHDVTEFDGPPSMVLEFE